MQDFMSYPFEGKRVLVRVDFNVPFDKTTGLISDPSRIERTVPTIQHIASRGGRVILISHMGRPKGEASAALSLRNIVRAVEAAVGKTVKFVPELTGAMVERAVTDMKDGEILLLENARFYPEEEAKVKQQEGEEEERFLERKSAMKSKQIALAKSVARYGDCFVNDAFGAAHRAHATTTYIAYQFPEEHRMFGLLMGSEIEAMERFTAAKAKPVMAIMGGAKVSDKLPLIEHLMERVDRILVGGGMAYTFIKARGGNIGKSLCEEEHIATTRALMEKAKARGVEIILPVDSANGLDFKADTTRTVTPIDSIPAGEMGMDIGPESAKLFREKILESKAILWNGPMGVFEFSTFAQGTMAVGEALAEATRRGAYSLVGGGDSVAALRAANLLEAVSYVSTGGGAMLEYLEGKNLPGISAVREGRA